MLARQLVLLFASIVGLFGLIPAAFVVLLAIFGEKRQAYTELAIVICAAFIVWEVIELILARRAGVNSIVRLVSALIMTVITAAAYLLARLVFM